MIYQNEYKCPICESKNIERLTSNYYNVYSELISKFLKCHEKILINEFYKSAKCKNCTTLFWLEPISKEIRKELYTRILPTHPKGEDSTGKYFSIEGLQMKLKDLSINSQKRKRIIEGYISSMKFTNNNEKEIIFELINKGFKGKEDLIKLKDVFSRGAKPYSRHVGFRKTDLNPIIINLMDRVKSSEYDYIEYGSPNWGPINTFNQSNYRCLSILPENSIFWSCINEEKNKRKSIKIIKESSPDIKKIDFTNSILGMFLVVDHLENPIEFIDFYLKKGVSSLVILLEKIDSNKGLPIQHLTAWNEEGFKYLAKHFSMKVEFPKLESNSYISAILTKE